MADPIAPSDGINDATMAGLIAPNGGINDAKWIDTKSFRLPLATLREYGVYTTVDKFFVGLMIFRDGKLEPECQSGDPELVSLDNEDNKDTPFKSAEKHFGNLNFCPRAISCILLQFGKEQKKSFKSSCFIFICDSDRRSLPSNKVWMTQDEIITYNSKEKYTGSNIISSNNPFSLAFVNLAFRIWYWSKLYNSKSTQSG